jgi:DNA-binding ferritin-like protein (Dps family)
MSKSPGELGAYFTKYGNAVTSMSTSILDFSDSIWKLATVEVTDSSYVFSPVCELFERWYTVTANAADLSIRIGDDLRDITERSKVLDRFEKSYKDATRANISATDKLAEFEDQALLDSKRPDFNQTKAGQTRAKLRETRKAALTNLRDATQNLIIERQKFSKFAYRRTVDAFRRLGQLLSENNCEEAAVVAKLIEGMQHARLGESLETTNIGPIRPRMRRENPEEEPQIAQPALDEAEPLPSEPTQEARDEAVPAGSGAFGETKEIGAPDETAPAATGPIEEALAPEARDTPPQGELTGEILDGTPGQGEEEEPV